MFLHGYGVIVLGKSFAGVGSVNVKDTHRQLIGNDDTSGYISIDCGNDKPNKSLGYVSDAAFVDTGSNWPVLVGDEFDHDRHNIFKTVRSFPDNKRACYALKLTKGLDYNYLIRARFMYGNYDGKYIYPTFDLYIGTDFWTEISLEDASSHIWSEILHKPTTDYINVCLVNINEGTPFISALYLRPLNRSMYNFELGSLYTSKRYFMDAAAETTQLYNYRSYPEDPYDRFWSPLPRGIFNRWEIFGRNNENMSNINDLYKIPAKFFMTGAEPYPGNRSLAYISTPNDPSDVFYIYWHFLETQKLSKHETREFEIYCSGNTTIGPIRLNYMEPVTIASPSIVLGSQDTKLWFFINQTNASTLPPVLSAFELYGVDIPSQQATNQTDATAIMKIKSMFGGLIRGWQGDPCLPSFPWSGLSCSDAHSPRIISLNLANMGLSGDVMPALFDLTALKYLNLSQNSLTGSIPEFLAQMPLESIDLSGNNLNGSVPDALIEKTKSGLVLRLDGNPDLCTADTCRRLDRKKNNIVTPLAAIAPVLLIVVVLAVFGVYKWRRQAGVFCIGSGDGIKSKSETMKSKGQEFSYSDLVGMTNNFQKMIGRGGYGNVYYGSHEYGEVAVKILNPSSELSVESFQTEAELLMRVHHRNLVPLVGYCHEGNTMALIYKYMENGDVQAYLSAQQTNVASWKERLQISVDAAQGLVYLHRGCKPAIIHRNVKPANMLLDEKMQAKIADFGMSRIFASESASHISTNRLAGTPGYLDPEYNLSYRLTEKSDVYSFGVVLLELITGRKAIIRSGEENMHITSWVTPLFERGEIHQLMDARFQGEFSISSAWKALETTMSCVTQFGIQRPSMAEVLADLKNCLTLELARGMANMGPNLEQASLGQNGDSINVDSEANMGPSPR